MSELDTGRFREIQDLLDSHIIRETAPAESPTLLQIAGFPHWENVYSSILGFFLDTSQAHGFGPLFIRSIMSAYRAKHRQDDWLEGAETVEATDAVEREVRTNNGKRIDLLVDCADFRLCIENKIWADLYNDLGHYRQHCEEGSDGRPVFGIVLSPDGVTSPELAKHGFVSMTYEDLVNEVRQLMGSHIGPHNTRYQYLLFDFLEQASHFSRTTNMNDDEQAFLDFWKENDPKISNIEEWIKKMWGLLDAKSKAQAHLDQCKEELSETKRTVFQPWIYQKSVAVFDLEQGGTVDWRGIFLDVEFHPLRITHVLGRRRGTKPNALVREINNCLNNSCEPHFSESPTEPGRFKFVTEGSPFDNSVCENAVKTSVAILKYIAERRLSDQAARV